MRIVSKTKISNSLSSLTAPRNSGVKWATARLTATPSKNKKTRRMRKAYNPDQESGRVTKNKMAVAARRGWLPSFPAGEFNDFSESE